MEIVPKEKPKNDRRRPFPWWLLFVGFASGVLVTLALTMNRGGTVTVYSSAPEDILRQATMLVHDATLTAQAPLGSTTLDPLLATATAFILEASQQAAGDGGMEAVNATATAIILQATQQAANPPGSS